MDKGTCHHSDGCEQPVWAKELCKKHYMDERANRLAQEKCKNPQCDNPRGGTGGWCPACYNRVREYGDPNAGPPRRKRKVTSRKVGTRSEYHVNHAMVRKERGPAWQQACEHCGGKAKQWATIHGRSGASPDDYMPLCGPCHHKYDGLVKNLPDNTGSKRTPETCELLSRKARERWADPAQRQRASQTAILREARKRAARAGSGDAAVLF